MTVNEHSYDIEELAKSFEPPILIISTHVGRGMFYLGEAVREKLENRGRVYHAAIEEFLPRKAFAEDLTRYKFISNKCRLLLYLIYKVPFFYWRKFIREKYWRQTSMEALVERISTLQVRTVICISHRAAFWASSMKWQKKMNIHLWDMLGEYGMNLGYRYLFWEQINGFLSPIAREELSIMFPDKTEFKRICLPARREYEVIRQKGSGDFLKILLVCGYWGQGPFKKVVQSLRRDFPSLRIYVVCGENNKMLSNLQREYHGDAAVIIYGQLDSLAALMEECGAIITKPGIATIVEAHAARRKIFLLPGMPIAEDNNARFALENFGAEMFSLTALRRWLEKVASEKEEER